MDTILKTAAYGTQEGIIDTYTNNNTIVKH